MTNERQHGSNPGRFTLSALALIAACAAPEPEIPATPPPSLEEIGVDTAALGIPLPSCSSFGSTGWDAVNFRLTLQMTAGVSAIIVNAPGGVITVNGVACVSDATGRPLTGTLVKKILILGTSADEHVVLDLLGSTFGTRIMSATGGITVDMGAGVGTGDAFSIRGTGAVDNITAGSPTVAANGVYFDILSDHIADVRVVNADSIAVSLGAGNDVFNASGEAAMAGGHLGGGAGGPAVVAVTTTGPVTTGIRIFGGDGDDTLTGGNGNDSFSGGNGNDLMRAGALTDGADAFDGGAGTDTVDYSLRLAGDMVITIGAATPVALDANDGLANGTEGDDVRYTVENILGGGGNDTITGSAVSNVISGGAGDDIISGGANSGSCTADIDTLNGNDGNDSFDMGSASDCADVLNGGLGSDSADYGARTVAVVLSLDTVANDGEALEVDNIKGDVEAVYGGTAADTITGSANADILHGGAGDDVINGLAGNDTLVGDTGNDTLNGGAGNDTIVEGGSDTHYTVALANGGGDDIINGGADADVADYSGRLATETLSITICVAPTVLTGATGLPSTDAQCADHDGDTALTTPESDNNINVETVNGGAGDDILTAGATDAILEGNAGDDTLTGGAGNDTLYGDAGNDTLLGMAGDDYLDSGAGTTDSLDGGAGDGDVCLGGTPVANTCEL